MIEITPDLSEPDITAEEWEFAAQLDWFFPGENREGDSPVPEWFDGSYEYSLIRDQLHHNPVYTIVRSSVSSGAKAEHAPMTLFKLVPGYELIQVMREYTLDSTDELKYELATVADIEAIQKVLGDLREQKRDFDEWQSELESPVEPGVAVMPDEPEADVTAEAAAQPEVVALPELETRAEQAEAPSIVDTYVNYWMGNLALGNVIARDLSASVARFWHF